MPAQRRCAIVAGAAPELARVASELIELCRSPQRTDDTETIASELIPLCEALRFIGRRGAKVIRGRRINASGRPLWLWGVTSELTREPHGTVLIIGTWNYPLLLPGVQVAQALAAGNRVLMKPAPGTEAATKLLVDCFHAAGVPEAAIRLLESAPGQAMEAMDRGVDLIVLTGSAGTGRQVLARAAQKITPAIVELSGCDAVIALPTADPNRLTSAIDFGLNFNSGATCIGPRRLIVEDRRADGVLEQLAARLANRDQVTVHPAARATVSEQIETALARGAEDRCGRYSARPLQERGEMYPLLLDRVGADWEIASSDLFAPVLSVIRVGCIDEAVSVVNGCRYRLAASVFGKTEAAWEIARRLDVGSVTINDLIVPTADPRLPFGGRGESGYGVTRGEEGLLAMTVPKVISHRSGNVVPHLSPPKESDAEALLGFLQMSHGGGLRGRIAGLRRMMGSVKTSSTDT